MTDAEARVDSLLLVGTVWRAHGLRGEIKVIPETDEPKRFEVIPVLYVGKAPTTSTKHAVEGVRFQPTKKGTIVIVKLADVATRDDAENLRASNVYAHPDDLPPLNDEEYFLHELIGLRAVRENGDDIGVVNDVLELPGQDLLVIGRAGRSSAMVPAVSEFVTDIDLQEGRLVIRPIEGLLDE